jgi:hypothetical protein
LINQNAIPGLRWPVSSDAPGEGIADQRALPTRRTHWLRTSSLFLNLRQIFDFGGISADIFGVAAMVPVDQIDAEADHLVCNMGKTELLSKRTDLV